MPLNRCVLLPVLALAFACIAPPTRAQQSVQSSPADAAADLHGALTGRWVGVLEYRDYKEPAGSLKRVALPTWLTVQAAGTEQRWHYVYDDGPGKVVDEDEQVTFDMAQGTCTIRQPGKAPQVYRAAGYSALKSVAARWC